MIIAQLTYGLSTLNITPSIYDKLNAFHMRGLTYILNVEHSYYSHISNEEVIDRANLAINKCEDQEITWQQLKVDKNVKILKR